MRFGVAARFGSNQFGSALPCVRCFSVPDSFSNLSFTSEGCDEAAGIKRAKRVRGPGLEDKAKQRYSLGSEHLHTHTLTLMLTLTLTLILILTLQRPLNRYILPVRLFWCFCFLKKSIFRHKPAGMLDFQFVNICLTFSIPRAPSGSNHLLFSIVSLVLLWEICICTPFFFLDEAL